MLGIATSASRARVPFSRERGAQALVRSFSVCTSSTRSRLSPVQVVSRAAVPDKSRLFPPAARNALLAELVNTGRFLGNTQNTVRMLRAARSEDYVFLREVGLQVDRNLMLYLPRLAVLVRIEADRPGAWFPGPLGPYLT